MRQKQNDIRTLRALLVVANGGPPGEDYERLLDRSTLAFQRLRDGVRESERRRAAVRAPYACTQEERCAQEQGSLHIGRGCMDDVGVIQ